MKENWRDVVGYEGLYEVSNLGRVRNRKGGRLRYLKCNKNKYGYIQVILCKNDKKKTLRVHRIEWEAFNGPIPDGMQIDHINTVRDDNRLENLRVATPKENQNNSLTLSNMREAANRRAENPQWLEKMREVANRRAENPQWREKMREVAKKRLENPQWCQKNRDANRRRLAKPVIQLDVKTSEVIRRWECASDAARELSIDYTNISACCNGRQKTAGGFKWKFA